MSSPVGTQPAHTSSYKTATVVEVLGLRLGPWETLSYRISLDTRRAFLPLLRKTEHPIQLCSMSSQQCQQRLEVNKPRDPVLSVLGESSRDTWAAWSA